MHAIFNRASSMWLLDNEKDVRARRTTWITPSDRLSMGPYGTHYRGVTIKIGDAISTFGSIAISFKRLKQKHAFARFDKILSLGIHLVPKLRVVVQTIVIVISDKPTRYGTVYPLRNRTSGDLTASASFLGEDESSEWTYENMHGASACDTPTHFVEVVGLHDRRRLNELTTLVMAHGGSSWTSQHRMDATYHWNRSYCFDCLMRWWEHNGKGVAVAAVHNAYKQLYVLLENNFILEESANYGTEMIPAVNFLIKFPEIDPPGINPADAKTLIGPVPAGYPPGESDSSSEGL
uniref:Uncharacterized protein n=1 Tax=Colletotrichum fructicola (strain Nara gc5) TaxID=1213859 RepID=L2FHX3_COLFN